MKRCSEDVLISRLTAGRCGARAELGMDALCGPCSVRPLALVPLANPLRFEVPRSAVGCRSFVLRATMRVGGTVRPEALFGAVDLVCGDALLDSLPCAANAALCRACGLWSAAWDEPLSTGAFEVTVPLAFSPTLRPCVDWLPALERCAVVVRDPHPRVVAFSVEAECVDLEPLDRWRASRPALRLWRWHAHVRADAPAGVVDLPFDHPATALLVVATRGDDGPSPDEECPVAALSLLLDDRIAARGTAADLAAPAWLRCGLLPPGSRCALLLALSARPLEGDGATVSFACHRSRRLVVAWRPAADISGWSLDVVAFHTGVVRFSDGAAPLL